MHWGLGRVRWVLGVTTLSAFMVVATASQGAAAPTPAPTTKGFTTGKWTITFDASFTNTGPSVNSVVDVTGQGDANVEGGQLTATCTAQGATSGTVTLLGQTHTVSGALTVSGCSFAGPATAPVWSATTGFAGSVDNGGSNVTFGAIQSTLTIETATHDLVTGDWTVDLRANAAGAGVTATGPASFIAVRNGQCPKSGPVTPALPDGRVMNGTATSPTMVRVEADPSVSGSPVLEAGLQGAIVTWNATLAGAGRHIVFATAAGPGPVVRIGVDSPTVRQAFGTNQPVDPAAAAEVDIVKTTTINGIKYVDEANVILAGNGLSAKEPWSSLTPALVEHVIMHELGHVLGLRDHSGSATDSIMWTKKGTLRSHHSPTVSCGDIRALQAL